MANTYHQIYLQMVFAVKYRAAVSVKRKFTFKGDTIILEPISVNRRLKWIRQQ